MMKFRTYLDQLRLKREVAFTWLNATQFLGTMNETFFLLLVQILIVGLAPAAIDELLASSTVLFALPFLFLAPLSGFIADRFQKNRVAVVLKYAELIIVALAIPAFYWESTFWSLLFLFLFAAQSALFLPTKLSMLPDLVKKGNLPLANASIAAWGFLALICGAVSAPALGKLVQPHYTLAVLVCLVLSLSGVFTSRRVWHVPAANPEVKPDLNFLRQLRNTAAWMFRDKMLALLLVGTGFYSLCISFLQIGLASYGMEYLKLSSESAFFLFFFLAFGAAAGSIFCGALSDRNAEMGLMPIGAGIFAVMVLLIGLLHRHLGLFMLDLMVFTAGFGSGLFIVPLTTVLQQLLPDEKRGEGLAFYSFVSWGGILCAGLLFGGLSSVGVSPATRMIVLAFFAILLSIGCFHVLREFFVRLLVTILTKCLYRVRTIGIENVPVTGPAMLIANHASYMDALLLCATSRRRIRFLMAPEMIQKMRWLKPVFSLYRVIPVSVGSSPLEIVHAFKEARRALDEGYLVCVFPEGGITRTGTIRSFKRGYERIVRGTDYPLIPVYMGGSWGTIYSYYSGELLKRWRRALFHRYHVTVLFGSPMPPHTSAFRIRRAVMELSCDYFNARKGEHSSVGKAVVAQCRSNWSKPFCDDTTGLRFTFGRTLTAALLLARAISKRTELQMHIGILLPTCAANMLCNTAVALLGKSSVNLNFTVGKAAFLSSVQQCNLRTILTSRKFLEKFPDLPVEASSLVFVEDLLKGATKAKKISALLSARLLPLRWMVRTARTSADSISTIIFSSGSTGEPKGVMLSQHNILSEVESLRMLLATTEKDHITAALPFFHSFGLMGCLWYPMLTHVRTTYHSNPLEAAAIIEIVRKNHSTMLWGTPTFLSLYLRRANPEDFASLKVVLAGGEKLKESLIQAYLDKFGIRPLEAYGATELSPGIAVSVPPGKGGDIVQAGYKEGRAGLPCAGIAMKIIDPDTGEEKGASEPGLLYLRGPNVMLGYLGRQDLTDEVLRDGWYCTGDIAFIDEDGFVGLTDRLSRFSKIGGEMVPHIGVEEALVNAASLPENCLAVTGLPDEKKGEKLVVLYTEAAGTPESLLAALEKTALPNIWRPARCDWHQVESIPLLGTGKPDLSGIKKLAAEKDQQKA